MKRFALLILLLLSACPISPPPPPVSNLKISTPVENQTVGGTIAVSANASTGQLSNLKFKLGNLEVNAPDGTANLNTRSLPDGASTLEASAVIDGTSVSSTVKINLKNDLPSSGTVTTDGGALKSSAGSLAMLPPGAVSSNVNISVEDLSQAKIKQDYKVDYEALGVTFLGALDVKASGASKANLPIQVDLKGWAEKVQPNHQVVMFGLAPDADGDGTGELMAVADAQATSDGSVITRPTPQAQVSVSSVASQSRVLGLRTTTSPQNLVPGQVLQLNARGFLPGSPFSNVAVFEPGGLEVLASPTVNEKATYNPQMQLEVVVPNLPVGNASVKFKNLSTGYSSDNVALTIAISSGADAWQGFVNLVKTAATKLTQGRSASFTANVNSLLTTLETLSPGVAANMVTASGLVNAGNQTTLEGITAATYTYGSPQYQLVRTLALMLDSVAASVPDVAVAATDLAGVLLTSTPLAAGSNSTQTAPRMSLQNISTRDQDFGHPCNSPGSNGFGPTGMDGAPPPGGDGCGGGGGGGGGGSSVNNPTTRTNTRASRVRHFGPVAGAIVRIFRRGTGTKLSPFTSITDENGYYYIPFIAQGEPFTVSAINPKTGAIATAEGVGVAYGKSVYVPLVFEPPQVAPGAPISSFTKTLSDTDPAFTYAFNPSASVDSDGGTISDYLWNFGDDSPTVSSSTPEIVKHRYSRLGSFLVKLIVTDNSLKTGISSQVVVVQGNGTLPTAQIGALTTPQFGHTTQYELKYPNVTDPITISIRYSSNHPSPSRRNQCFIVEYAECSVVIQPGAVFKFNDQAKLGLVNQPEYPNVSDIFTGIQEPIEITAISNTGAASSTTFNLSIPAPPELPLIGTGIEQNCDLGEAPYRFVEPNGWYALEVTDLGSSSYEGIVTSYRQDVGQQGNPPLTSEILVAGKSLDVKNRTVILEPAFGIAGRENLVTVYAGCPATDSLKLKFRIVNSSGTINVGELSTINTPENGGFYTSVVPANAPTLNQSTYTDLVAAWDSRLTLEGYGTPIASPKLITNGLIGSSPLRNNSGFSSPAQTGTTIPVAPLPSSSFALYFAPGQSVSTKILVGVPAQPVTLSLGSTLSGTLKPFIMRDPFNAEIPPNTFALLRTTASFGFGDSISDATNPSWQLLYSSSGQVKQTVTNSFFRNSLSINPNYELSLDAPKANLVFDQILSDTLPGSAFPGLQGASLYTFDITQRGKVTIAVLAGSSASYTIFPPGNTSGLTCSPFVLPSCLGQPVGVAVIGKYALVVDNKMNVPTPYSFKLGFTP